MTIADKNIIVILPPEFELYKAIDKNLQHMGFAQWLVLSPKFKHSLKTRVANFVFKHLLGHKEYKRKIVATYYSNTIASHLKSYQAQSVDFIVVVRPDLLQDDALNEVARVARKRWPINGMVWLVFRAFSMLSRVSIASLFSTPTILRHTNRNTPTCLLAPIFISISPCPTCK